MEQPQACHPRLGTCLSPGPRDQFLPKTIVTFSCMVAGTCLCLTTETPAILYSGRLMSWPDFLNHRHLPLFHEIELNRLIDELRLRRVVRRLRLLNHGHLVLHYNKRVGNFVQNPRLQNLDGFLWNFRLHKTSTARVEQTFGWFVNLSRWERR